MQKPNILYIMSDQHAGRCLGVNGDQAAITPNIDRLAQEGVRFSRAYCPSPVCLPSRMSILTSRHPHEQECWTNNDVLASDRPTWAHGLGAAGYHTVLCGRMHALGPDQLHGFAERRVGDHSPNWPGVSRTSLGELAGTSGPNPVSIEKSGSGTTSYDQLDEDVTATAIDFLESVVKEETGKPFCLAVGYMLPHPPYVARPEDYEAVADLVGDPEKSTAPDHPWIKTWRQAKKLDKVDVRDVARARIAYYGMIRRLDINIGRLLSALEATGQADNTIIVYFSDHGDHIGEHGLFWKHSFFDESVLVPLVIRVPGQKSPGSVVDDAVSVGALGMTLLDLVGADLLPNATMSSFRPLLDFGEISEVEPVFIEYCTDGSTGWEEGLAVQQRGVVHDGFKYVFYHSQTDQMFDLRNDSGEVNNLADNPTYAERAAKLKRMVLADWNPVQIADRLAERLKDKRLLSKWGDAVQPPDSIRWPLDPDQNRLTAPTYATNERD